MNSPSQKRKIAVAVTHRAPYGRLKSVLRAIQEHPHLELQIVVGNPVFMQQLLFALWHGDRIAVRKHLPWYLRTRLKTFFSGEAHLNRVDYLSGLIRRDGFPIAARLPVFFEGGNLAMMTKSVGMGLLQMPAILEKLKSDMVLVNADRFEMLSFAAAAAFMNLPLAHIQGGEVSGTIDETVRHVITKMAHLHFPTTEASKERLIKMGEDPQTIFMTGCPTIDVLKHIDYDDIDQLFARNGPGYGDDINLRKPFLLVIHHPVTTEYSLAQQHVHETLEAVREIGMPTLLLSSNLDAGSDGVSSEIRSFAGTHRLPSFKLIKNLLSEDFYRVLKRATVAVGNSSSFIREGSALGTPVVLVGTRQRGREHGANVISDVPYDRIAIKKSIEQQIAHGPYLPETLYGDGRAGARIAEILATANPSLQKQITY